MNVKSKAPRGRVLGDLRPSLLNHAAVPARDGRRHERADRGADVRRADAEAHRPARPHGRGEPQRGGVAAAAHHGAADRPERGGARRRAGPRRAVGAVAVGGGVGAPHALLLRLPHLLPAAARRADGRRRVAAVPAARVEPAVLAGVAADRGGDRRRPLVPRLLRPAQCHRRARDRPRVSGTRRAQFSGSAAQFSLNAAAALCRCACGGCTLPTARCSSSASSACSARCSRGPRRRWACAGSRARRAAPSTAPRSKWASTRRCAADKPRNSAQSFGVARRALLSPQVALCYLLGNVAFLRAMRRRDQTLVRAFISGNLAFALVLATLLVASVYASASRAVAWNATRELAFTATWFWRGFIVGWIVVGASAVSRHTPVTLRLHSHHHSSLQASCGTFTSGRTTARAPPTRRRAVTAPSSAASSSPSSPHSSSSPSCSSPFASPPAASRASAMATAGCRRTRRTRRRCATAPAASTSFGERSPSLFSLVSVAI